MVGRIPINDDLQRICEERLVALRAAEAEVAALREYILRLRRALSNCLHAMDGAEAMTRQWIVYRDDARDLVYGQSVRAAVLVNGKTVTGSLILSPAMMDEPNAKPLEFTPDPTGKHANIFA